MSGRPAVPAVTYAAGTRHVAGRWEQGKCPCCGGALTDPAPLGAGIDICGVCAGSGHCLRAGSEYELGRAVIASIRGRNDGPIAELLPGSYLPCSSAVTA